MKSDAAGGRGLRVGGRVLGAFAVLGLAMAATGCSEDPAAKPTVDQSPPASPGGVVIPSGELPLPADDTILLPGGGMIHLVDVAGTLYMPIEGTFLEESYRAIRARGTSEGLSAAERTALLRGELDASIAIISKSMRVLHVQMRAEVGFFTALVPLDQYQTLGQLRGMSQTILVNPVVWTPMDERVSRKVSLDKAAGLTAFDDPRVGSAAFSGLLPIGVPEFLATVTPEIGSMPDGANVKVGITDTGITYNHPTFEDGFGQRRIGYMKDFTGEGRMYFSPSSKFEITLPQTVPAGTDPNALLLMTADFLVSSTGSATPKADKPSNVDKTPILVSPALRTILTTPGSGVRLGVLSEAAFGTAMDINANGKTNDLLWAIYVPGQGGALGQVYLDVTARGDFRNSTALGSFNDSKTTQRAFAERFGVDIKEATILDSAGADVKVITAAVVGYDPGNHGSHVAGIVGGRRTLANDPSDTLARGAAPAVTLMSNRICAINGGCNGTDAIIDLAQNGAEVINMSIGGLSATNDGYGVQETVINRLTQQYNTLFVISAGNSGPGRQTVGSPSVARLAISVAATASRALIERQYQWPGSGKITGTGGPNDDFLLYFSSRGPTAAGGFKPDIAAPGTELSSIQLNAPPGSRAGLDVYWGTSMAAPTTAGAIALFIDAAKRYNAANPQSPLALDSTTLRRVIVGSARPFDVTTLDTKTGDAQAGQYTFIDQGLGMLNLPRAWAALKAERETRRPAAVSYVEGGKTTPVMLDYEVRALRTNPNGLKYDGTTSLTIQGALQAKFGRGVWIDYRASDSMFPIQIARRLPTSVTSRADIADLARALRTTGDEFVIETTIHGSQSPWLKAGTLSGLDCTQSPESNVFIVGEGAIDVPVDADSGVGGSIAPRDSSLYACADRALMNALPPGDHGAIIRGYRTSGGVREASPSFIVPVYVTVPHALLAGKAGYTKSGSVRSFGVARNYVEVPTGTSLVKVTLEVPPATIQGTAVSGCAGVELEGLEGGNTLPPLESKTTGTRARNCSSFGGAGSAAGRKFSYTRTNPTPGIWDLHVFGLFNFANSPYTLTVDFAKLTSSLTSLDGPTTVLSGSFTVDTVDGSFTVTPSATASKYTLRGFSQQVSATATTGGTLNVPDGANVVARAYAADIASVTIATGGSPGNDIDLTIKECDDATLAVCTGVGTSGGATDVETVTFTPKAGKFYVAVVDGYAVPKSGVFQLTETLAAKAPETGTVAITTVSPTSTKVDFAFNLAASTLALAPRFTSGSYSLVGDIVVSDAAGTPLVRVPVTAKP